MVHKSHLLKIFSFGYCWKLGLYGLSNGVSFFFLTTMGAIELRAHAL